MPTNGDGGWIVQEQLGRKLLKVLFDGTVCVATASPGLIGPEAVVGTGALRTLTFRDP